MPKGTHVIGEQNGKFFDLISPVNGYTKMSWIKAEPVIVIPPPPIPPPADRPRLWRIKHDIELGALWRDNLPEVHPFFPNHHVPFLEVWQRLSRELNPLLTDEKWTAVYSFKRFATNNNGFGNPDDPRANYITGTHLDKADPRVEVLKCGGNLVTGYPECSPRVWG